MSYILDALRKSEAERHQGQVPHLGANPMLIHAGRRQQPLWPYILTGALLLNAGIVGFWLYHSKDEKQAVQTLAEPQVTTPAVVTTEAPAQSQAPIPAVVEAEPVYGNRGEAPVVPTQPVAPPVVAASPPVVATPNSSTPVSAAVEPEVIRPSSRPVGSQPVVPSYDPPMGSDAVIITPETARQALAYDPRVGYMDDTAPDARYYRALGPGEDLSRLPADTPAIQVPYLEDMPESFRRRVPTMHFNSHIFASEPSARRIMVNNIYLRQGQSFAGMTVQEITEDGAIFVLDGVMFAVSAAKEWINR